MIRRTAKNQLPVNRWITQEPNQRGTFLLRHSILASILGVVSVVCLAGATPGTPALAGDSSFAHYYYFEEERPLLLDSSRLAAFAEDGRADGRLGDILRSGGWRSIELDPHPVGGWTLFTLNEASGAPSIAGASEALVARAMGRLLDVDKGREFFYSPVFQGDFGRIVVAPSVLVRLRPNLSEEAIHELLAKLDVPSVSVSSFGGMERAWRLHGGFASGIETLRIANRLARQPEVEWAEPEMISSGRSSYIPSDSGFSGSWGLHNTGQSGGVADVDIDAPEAWELTLGDTSILTVIIDVGVDQGHPDIHQVGGRDFTGETTPGDGGPANSCDNHGTAVAGVVSAIIDGGGAAVGVAPGTRVASARTFTSNTPTCDGTWIASYAWTVDALDWALQIGARVTNNSNYYSLDSSAVAAKYAETRDLGMVHFASAGNSYGGSVSFPAKLPDVHAVSAVDRTGELASFSSMGPEVSVSAPGVDIFTTDRTGSAGYNGSSYVTINGTSFAAPMAAGVSALLISRAPLLTPDGVRDVLEGEATDLGPASWDPSFGCGLVNAASSLSGLEIFSDDFESGDTSSWSDARP